MRSPLELLEGRFEHALLTTYSFNLRFFEEWVLRALWAAEVRNVVVFVDPGQLGHALADRAPSAAGRAYHVVAARTAKAAFHPKVLLVAGADGARLCVSSANLTADGQLRNAESAIAFDSNIAGNLRPILDAGEFFRRLSVDAPPHTAAAILKALARLPDDNGEDAPFRLVHNLDGPLLDAFPSEGPTTAVAPYVDADGRTARRLAERGALTVIVDGEQIAASTEFFAGPWTVDARKFDARLHGKAYEVSAPSGRWILVGSPNLSEVALLRPAASGNLEVAVTIDGQQALELPPSQPWDGENLPESAASRLLAERSDGEVDQPAAAGAFDAWEDENRIVLSGIPDGSRIERWVVESWHPLGVAADGAVLLADPDIRPTRLRALLPDERVAYAVVAQPARLRARARAPTSGRHSDAADHLPLDVATVRVLEEVLSQLYALSELAGEVPGTSRRTVATPGPRADDDAAVGLLAWMPRSPDEEPRVPPLYGRAWTGEPDVLLALVSRVLRLDQDDTSMGEDHVGLEQIGLEELGEITGTEQVEVESPQQAATSHPPVDRDELERYRRAFSKLFERGTQFVATSDDPTLAGWTFTYLLRLVEDLGSHHVRVGGQDEALMPRANLSGVTLELLERYLGRGEHDPLCLATARAHLAAAVRERPRYSARDVERLDALAFAWASELISLPPNVPAPKERDVGLDLAGAIALLDDYAERSGWGAIEKEAATRLDDAWIERDPWPTIVGRASFEGRMQSPAWELLSFAAPAGYASMIPFAVVVHNATPVLVVTHAVICVPAQQLVVEVVHRAADGAWLERRYAAPNRATVERMTNPTALDATTPLTECDLDAATEPLRALVPLLALVAETLS